MTEKTKTKGWPDSRRREQAARCRRQKPWEKATGPRTAAGKEKVAQNALRHGFRSAAMAEMRALLRRQRAFVKAVLAAGEENGQSQ